LSGEVVVREAALPACFRHEYGGSSAMQVSSARQSRVEMKSVRKLVATLGGDARAATVQKT
jgi:hypothetical protein